MDLQLERPASMLQPIVAFAAEVLRFTLRPRQAAILDEIYRDGIRIAVLRLGRRSGKGRIAAVVACYEAVVNAALHLSAVPAGEPVYVIVLASSQRQARTVHGYIRSFLRRSPELARLVDDRAAGARDTKDEIALTNGVTLVTLPANAAAVRSYAAAVVILDEAAHFKGVDGSPLNVEELWQAVSPTMAQFPARRALIMSTPRWATGWFADMCEKASSGKFPWMRHWHATTAEMDPSTSMARYLGEEQAADPASFAREYEAAFDSSIEAVFDEALVRSAFRRQEQELAPAPGVSYLVSCDPAYTGDRFVAIVGHRTSEAVPRVVVDRIRAWQGSRSNPVRQDITLDEIAAMANAYNGAPVRIDQYAAEPIRQGLADRGVHVAAVPWTNESKVDAVAAARRVMYASRLDGPEFGPLITELISLEQKPTPGGRPRIAAARGQHDDYAMALLALVDELEPSNTPGLLDHYRRRAAELDPVELAKAAASRPYSTKVDVAAAVLGEAFMR